MNTLWILKEEDFQAYKDNQFDEDNKNITECEHLGCLYIGQLCFDIEDNGDYLSCLLYVGGVEGYDESYKVGPKPYPYDSCDIADFKWENDLRNISFEDFKKELEEYCIEHIKVIEGYVSYGSPVNLIEIAEKEVLEW